MVHCIGLNAIRGSTRCMKNPRSVYTCTSHVINPPGFSYTYCKYSGIARLVKSVTSDNRLGLRWQQPARNMSAVIVGPGSTPRVTVEPGGHLLIDEELHIRMHGLDSGQEVTIHTVVNISGKGIESCCHFRADGDGVVDLCKQPSLGGSYTGVSPMGIFWSQEPTPDMPKGFRLIVKDLVTPLRAELTIYPGTHSAEDIRTKKPTPIATQEIDRWYKGQGVTETEVTDGRVRGKLYLPPGPGPFPGVIDLFGTVGGIVEFRSALFASRGIASLALPYFLYKDLPESLFDLDLDYFLEAVSWLRGHPKVYGKGVGAVGTSKGGDFSLLMAAHCPQVRAVVNINGCTFNSIFNMKFSGGDIPAVPMQVERMGREGEAFTMIDTFDYTEKDLTPVWNHNPKVLNILSEDDYCAPNECIRLMKRHYPADKGDNFTVLSYPGAGHLLEPPYTPCCRMSYHKSYGMYFMWGGFPKPHADAQEDAWRHILEFLHANIPKTADKRSKV